MTESLKTRLGRPITRSTCASARHPHPQSSPKHHLRPQSTPRAHHTPACTPILTLQSPLLPVGNHLKARFSDHLSTWTCWPSSAPQARRPSRCSRLCPRKAEGASTRSGWKLPTTGACPSSAFPGGRWQARPKSFCCSCFAAPRDAVVCSSSAAAATEGRPIAHSAAGGRRVVSSAGGRTGSTRGHGRAVSTIGIARPPTGNDDGAQHVW